MSALDWQGALDCLCQRCWTRKKHGVAEEWEAARKDSWDRRKKNAAQHKRIMCFKKAARDIPNDAWGKEKVGLS
jgi:hypothetical protein